MKNSALTFSLLSVVYAATGRSLSPEEVLAYEGWDKSTFADVVDVLGRRTADDIVTAYGSGARIPFADMPVVRKLVNGCGLSTSPWNGGSSTKACLYSVSTARGSR